MNSTNALKTSPEALGVWKKTQKMLAEACKELNRYQQMIERPGIPEKVCEENMVEAYDFDDSDLPDPNRGARQLGAKTEVFFWEIDQHATPKCSPPRGHRINVRTDKILEKRGTTEQVELQMKLAILQRINPRIARKPGPPRKKRPRRIVSEENDAVSSHGTKRNEETWLTGKDGSQKQVIFRDIIPMISEECEGLEDYEMLEPSVC